MPGKRVKTVDSGIVQGKVLWGLLLLGAGFRGLGYVFSTDWAQIVAACVAKTKKGRHGGRPTQESGILDGTARTSFLPQASPREACFVAEEAGLYATPQTCPP